ncbi:hypothetical protein B0H17DRAFT_1128206 [Mycena rosella]|uniref:Uncharacterized protein n=1 Tax=Mycena rosella TaxID=1033263 RepID=A0AAD7GPK5_MYCRO|nr:hypothetical protein B0H17DRAFT_1128206 [Mycena rosella]
MAVAIMQLRRPITNQAEGQLNMTSSNMLPAVTESSKMNETYKGAQAHGTDGMLKQKRLTPGSKPVTPSKAALPELLGKQKHTILSVASLIDVSIPRQRPQLRGGERLSISREFLSPPSDRIRPSIASKYEPNYQVRLAKFLQQKSTHHTWFEGGNNTGMSDAASIVPWSRRVRASGLESQWGI